MADDEGGGDSATDPDLKVGSVINPMGFDAAGEILIIKYFCENVWDERGGIFDVKYGTSHEMHKRCSFRESSLGAPRKRKNGL